MMRPISLQKLNRKKSLAILGVKITDTEKNMLNFIKKKRDNLISAKESFN